MPDYTANPTGADLKTWLMATGIIKEPLTGALVNLDFDSKVATALKEWKRATNYKIAFLAGEDETTLVYDAADVDENSEMKLRSGLVSVSSVGVSGIELTEGVDYVLFPRDAPLEGCSYKTIQFLTGSFDTGVSGAGAIAITGVVGYASTWPEDAFEAVIKRAAYHSYPQLSLKISGGRASLSAGKVKLEFAKSRGNSTSGSVPVGTEAESWLNDWRTAIVQYRRR